MARKFLTAIDLAKNELQNAAVQNLAAAPSSPVKGQLYYDTVGNILYWYNGTAWVSASGGSVAFGAITQEQTFGAVKSDGVATTAARSDHTHGNPTHVAADHANVPLNALLTATASYSMGGNRLTVVANPTSNQDAATKIYVDGLVNGVSWHAAVRMATTANITLSALQAIDGVTTVATDRVLVKNQTLPQENGIYAAASGGWTRVQDADVASEMLNLSVFVSEGTTQADTAWVCTADNPITLGTTPLPFVQFGSSTIAVNSVDNTKLADMPANTVKANNTGSTADPKDLTQAQFATMMGGYFCRPSTTTVGDGSTTSFGVAHNLGTCSVLVDVFRTASPYDTVEVDVERISINAVTIRFAVAPATNEYTVVVMG